MAIATYLIHPTHRALIYPPTEALATDIPELAAKIRTTFSAPLRGRCWAITKRSTSLDVTSLGFCG